MGWLQGWVDGVGRALGQWAIGGWGPRGRGGGKGAGGVMGGGRGGGGAGREAGHRGRCSAWSGGLVSRRVLGQEEGGPEEAVAGSGRGMA